MKSLDESKDAEKKRKRSEKRKSRDERMFFNFDAIGQQELKQYNEVVFVDSNLGNILFMMHISNSRNNRRIFHYTSMSRCRHMKINIARDREERFINHRDNTDEI